MLVQSLDTCIPDCKFKCYRLLVSHFQQVRFIVQFHIHGNFRKDGNILAAGGGDGDGTHIAGIAPVDIALGQYGLAVVPQRLAVLRSGQYRCFILFLDKMVNTILSCESFAGRRWRREMYGLTFFAATPLAAETAAE